MNIEPMRTISFDGETFYTVPRPVDATPEMVQPVGVDDEGRLFTEPGGGGGGVDNVFNVEYQVTPFADIKSASDAGKVCRMRIGVRIYYLLSINAAVGYFFWAAQGKNRMIVGCTSAGAWTDETADYVQTQTITDPGNYFTTDTVEGALQEIGAELSGINALIGSGVIT